MCTPVLPRSIPYCIPNDEKPVATRKATLELECMQKESDARIAAAATAAAVTATTPIILLHAQAPRGWDDDDNLGEVPQEVQNLVRFSGLPQEETVRIFRNKFKPINLYRLRHMRDICYDTYHDQDRIEIEDGVLKLKETTGKYKDFGKSVHNVWSNGFLNYAMIMLSLFGPTAPDLHAALSVS